MKFGCTENDLSKFHNSSPCYKNILETRKKGTSPYVTIWLSTKTRNLRRDSL
jgi:hypothetical protein